MKNLFKRVWENFKLDWKLKPDDHEGFIIIMFGSSFLIDLINMFFPLRHGMVIFLCLLPVMFLLYYGYLIKLPNK